MSESSNFSSNSSFDSISDLGDMMADDPLFNALTSGLPDINTGSGMPGINAGCGLSDVNVNSNSVTILTHPGYKNVMDALNYLGTLLTPIEYAFYLYGINDYLRSVVLRKEKRLRKRVSNDTLTSDAASIASLRIQALQEQYYSSFYGRTAAGNALSSNSVAHPSFHPRQNSFLIPPRNGLEDTLSTILPNGSHYDELRYRNGIHENCNNSQRFPAPLQSSACQSSLFQKKRNQASVSQINLMNSVNSINGGHVLNANSSGNQQMFSAMEDTFGSGKTANTMLLENSRNLSRRLMKPGPLHSSFVGKSRNNISSFQVNSSILSGSHSRQNNCSALPGGEIEEDQFNCVRVGPLSEKFHLPAIQEVEEDSHSSISLSEEEGPAQNTNNNDKPKEQNSSSTNKSTVQTNASKNFKPNLRKNSLDNKSNDKSIIQSNSSSKQVVLTNWTVVLINENLHLNGIKLINKKIVEKNHLSTEILYRTRQGIIKTEGDYFYTLEPPFVANEDMPEKVKHAFRSKKFPLTWRCMLSTWIEEKDRESNMDTEEKSSSPFVWRRKMSEKHTVGGKKVSGSEKKEDENPNNYRPTRKPPGKTNEAGRKRNKKPAPSGTAKKKPKQEKNENISEESSENEAKSLSQETNSKRARNKNNKKPTSSGKSGTTKKKPEPVKSQNVSEDLNSDVASSSSSEESSSEDKKKKKINKNLQKHVNGGGTSGKTSKKNKNNCFEDFEKSVINSLTRDKNSCTPSTLLKTLTKSSALPIGRHTPPLKLIGEMLKKNNVKSSENDTSSENISEKYVVAKRMTKTKGSKTVMNNNKKEESSADDEVQNLVTALTNKTPQTTPKPIREVFRNKEESRNSDSDFGSDVSSI